MLRAITTSRVFWVSLVLVSTVLSMLVAIFSLANGIHDLYFYFFLIPMFLVIYRFPEKGVIFTLLLGWINLTIVYAFGSLSAQVFAAHTAWFYIYVSLGIVITSLVMNSRARKEQLELLQRQAFQEIEQNMEQFEILNDEIRNPLQAILLDTDTLPSDAETKQHISEHVQTIEKILNRVDERILESEKVRKFLQKHYNFT
jgi:signal transduction histidine kinase